MLFYDKNKKDQTAKQYLEDIAKNYINEYQFYQIDISCNQHFYEEIKGLKVNNAGLVIYHPRTEKYVYLKAKNTKGVIDKFLKINLSESNKLPDNKFHNPDIILYSCNQKPESS